MKFGDLTYEEIKSYAETGALAVVPTAARRRTVGADGTRVGRMARTDGRHLPL